MVHSASPRPTRGARMCGRAHGRTGGLPFWNTFTDKGEVDFSGVHYKGKAHYYVMSGVNEPITDFWYFTDTEGKPVQQGEGGTGPTDQGYPTSIGHTIWHDYDQSTFDTSAIDASVFAIPAACKSTTTSCAFP